MIQVILTTKNSQYMFKMERDSCIEAEFIISDILNRNQLWFDGDYGYSGYYVNLYEVGVKFNDSYWIGPFAAEVKITDFAFIDCGHI